MAAKKKSAKPTLTKTAFVRSLPETMPAAEVVAKAKAAGVKLKDTNDVHKIRHNARVAKDGKRARRRRGSSVAPTPAPHASSSRFSAEEEAFGRHAIRMTSKTRAIEIVNRAFSKLEHLTLD